MLCPTFASSGPREGVTWWRSQPGSRSREHSGTNAHEWPSVTWLLVARTLQPVPPRPGCPWLHGVGGRLWKVWSPPPTSGPEPPPSARLHHSLSPLLLQSRLSATNGDTRRVAGSCTGDTSQYRCHVSPGPRCLGRGSERAHRAPAPPHPWLGSPPPPFPAGLRKEYCKASPRTPRDLFGGKHGIRQGLVAVARRRDNASRGAESLSAKRRGTQLTACPGPSAGGDRKCGS